MPPAVLNQKSLLSASRPYKKVGFMSKTRLFSFIALKNELCFTSCTGLDMTHQHYPTLVFGPGRFALSSVFAFSSTDCTFVW